MNYQREKELLVVKVGTNVLADTTGESEKLDDRSFESIGGEVRLLSDSGVGVILVSSGAITAGVIGEGRRREDIESATELQRYAARGWDTVVQKWKSVIGATRVSSTLLTKRELHTEDMRTKALGVINCCLAHNDVFVVNENDTISDDEIKFGDNDTLAAELAAVCAASGLFKSVKLVLLTNKDGLNKIADDDTTLIRTVTDIELVEQYAGNVANNHSRGGMKTKVQASKTACRAGVETFIANGRTEQAIDRALRREIGTYFQVVRHNSECEDNCRKTSEER